MRSIPPFPLIRGVLWETHDRGTGSSDIPSSLQRLPLLTCSMLQIILPCSGCPIKWSPTSGSRISNPSCVAIATSRNSSATEHDRGDQLQAAAIILGSRSMQRKKSNFLGQRVCVDWCFYDPYTRRAITDCKLEVLRDSPRFDSLANFATRLHHNVRLPRGEADDESDHNISNDCMSSECVTDDEVVENGVADGPVTVTPMLMS